MYTTKCEIVVRVLSLTDKYSSTLCEAVGGSAFLEAYTTAPQVLFC